MYRGSSLSRAVPRARQILLLSPQDPLAYYLSVRHELERRVEWEGDCPRAREEAGAWFLCRHSLKERGELYDLYECEELVHLAGSPPPYSRVTGCLVELLLLLTKARAGAVRGYVEHARWLLWCVERASRGNAKYVGAARDVLQELEALEGEGKGSKEAVLRDS